MFNKITYYLKNFGITNDTPTFLIRRIHLLTYINITCVSVALFYSFLFLVLGEWIPAILDSILVILFLPSLILNKIQKHKTANYVLIINVNIAIMIVSIVYGDEYRNELFYLVSSILGIIIHKKRFDAILSFIITIAFYIFSKSYCYYNSPLFPTDDKLIGPLSIVGFISVAIILYLLIVYIRNETDDYETKIINALNNLEEKKHYILDSLTYAANIQKTIVGNKEEVLNKFKDGFIILKPKDIVCGDFYWFSEVNGQKIIAAGDCTGHGVPAAFMTIMGNDFLNDIVIKENITSPDKILIELDKKIINKLSSNEGEERQDGMDISILVINDETKTMKFAGAKSTIFIVNDNELITVKGSHFPIGSTQYKETKEYELHNIKFNSGEKIYLFSDGYQDQFGGEKGKKFLTKKFRMLIHEISNETMFNQKQRLNEEFKNWKKNEDQTDDVLVIGLEL
ncbi:MAG: hypothetical protein CL846_02790 [Crocinitomicaceae bacterium]|nr:hypothetical protein [Crocinitomicaceae bacterium]|tara:strand:- start:1632 stop:2996 length:1365 start_codon:yes stop_codon:yes gene_type:complete